MLRLQEIVALFVMSRNTGKTRRHGLVVGPTRGQPVDKS
jgi:hypothetical protein